VHALPGGTITFRFTDIDSPTRLLPEHGDRDADLPSEHRRVLRAAFPAARRREMLRASCP
jgi:hypothetical protein